jgi:hypothetical protein
MTSNLNSSFTDEKAFSGLHKTHLLASSTNKSSYYPNAININRNNQQKCRLRSFRTRGVPITQHLKQFRFTVSVTKAVAWACKQVLVLARQLRPSTLQYAKIMSRLSNLKSSPRRTVKFQSIFKFHSTLRTAV